MATAYILFPVSEPTLPDGSGSGNAAATVGTEVSTGTQTSNSPKATQEYLEFSNSVDQHAMWNFIMPANYGSGGTVRGKFKMPVVTSGSVVFKAAIGFVTDDSTDDDVLVFNAVGTATVAVPATQGHVKEFSIALTMTGAAANRKAVLMVGRDKDNASDTAAGVMRLLGTLNLEFVTA